MKVYVYPADSDSGENTVIFSNKEAAEKYRIVRHGEMYEEIDIRDSVGEIKELNHLSIDLLNGKISKFASSFIESDKESLNHSAVHLYPNGEEYTFSRHLSCFTTDEILGQERLKQARETFQKELANRFGDNPPIQELCHEYGNGQVAYFDTVKLLIKPETNVAIEMVPKCES